MRIIGGRLKGIRFNAPESLPVRPTTDMAKEALFNILYNTYDFDSCDVLDLFCGTGNISFEFASRGVQSVTAVDKHSGCIYWVKSVIEKHQLNEITVEKADVFKYLSAPKKSYQIIFADPPYHDPQLSTVTSLFALLKPNGLMVLSYPGKGERPTETGVVVVDNRSYGNAALAFYRKEKDA